MTKHTPGPWRYDPKDGEIFHDDVESVHPQIATVRFDNTTNEQADADGRLIAAAPELLAALKRLKFACRHMLGYFDEADLAAFEAATLAIAKAEGN